jgi:hypothetical protein
MTFQGYRSGRLRHRSQGYKVRLTPFLDASISTERMDQWASVWRFLRPQKGTGHGGHSILKEVSAPWCEHPLLQLQRTGAREVSYQQERSSTITRQAVRHEPGIYEDGVLQGVSQVPDSRLKDIFPAVVFLHHHSRPDEQLKSDIRSDSTLTMTLKASKFEPRLASFGLLVWAQEGSQLLAHLLNVSNFELHLGGKCQHSTDFLCAFRRVNPKIRPPLCSEGSESYTVFER